MTNPTPGARWAPGTRLVVRRTLTGEEAAASGKKVTDVIGIVISDDGAVLRLMPDAGGTPTSAEPVQIAWPAIVAAKEIPPRPVRRPRA